MSKGIKLCLVKKINKLINKTHQHPPDSKQKAGQGRETTIILRREKMKMEHE